jgi:DNA-directed RNA polymerase subunit L
MPTKTFNIPYNLGPLIQSLLVKNKDVEFVGYNRPNLCLNDTVIEITAKTDPKLILEDALYELFESLDDIKIH